MANPGVFSEQRKAAKKLRVAPHIERYLGGMEKANPEKRVKLLEEIGKLMQPEVAHVFVTELAQYLDDETPAVRHATMNVLEIASKVEPLVLVQVLGPIAARLSDPDAHMRQHALELLAATGAKSLLDVLPFLASMAELYADADAQVTRTLIQALGDLGLRSPNAVVGHLVKALKAKEQQVVLNGLATLVWMGSHKPGSLKKVVPTLGGLMGDHKSPVGETTRELLSEVGCREPAVVMPTLTKVLKDLDASMTQQWAALRVATFMAEKHPSLFDPLLPQLDRNLMSNAWELREQAAMLVGQVGKQNLPKVKEVIPSLVECLSDPDELVRSAAMKAMDQIGISSVDYTRIEKASKALKNAEFIISSSRNFGAKVDQAEALMADARKAFTASKYADALDYATKAEKLAHRQEKLILEVRDLIKSSKDTIQSIGRAGISIKEPMRMLAIADKLLKRSEFKGARMKAQRAVKVAKEVQQGARPELALKGVLEQPMVAEAWNPLVITMRNLGAASARDVTLQFSDTFAIRGPSLLETLGPGKGKRLKLSCYPKSKGLVPFSIDITYHSFGGQYYSDHLKDILEVGVDQPDFRARELFVSPIQATIVPTDTGPASKPLVTASALEGGTTIEPAPVTRFSHVEEFFNICENCEARIPSNFRICGRCGHKMPTREQKMHRTCPACQTEVTGDFKFCGKCGSSLALNCPQCQTPLTEGFRFCGRCGAKVL